MPPEPAARPAHDGSATGPAEESASGSANGPATGPTFAPIARTERLADRVAAALIESITSGQLQPGDKLPPERDLCERFGVSRPVLREAVRSLIAKGLLEDSPRRGHVVSALGREAVTESLSLYLRGQRLDVSKLLEVRTVLEVENAGRAAERATAAQLADLRAAADAMHVGMSAEDAAIVDTGFHRAIATATGNEFFGVMLDSIRDVLITAQLPTLAEPTIVRGAIRHHLTILGRIEDGDPEGARTAMRAHLLDAERGLRDVLGR